MNFKSRVSLIVRLLAADRTGLLRAYAVPDRFDDHQQSRELRDMAEHINAEIHGDATEEQIEAIMRGTRFFLQRRHGRDDWPKIKVVLAALDDAKQDIARRNNGGTLIDLVSKTWQRGAYIPDAWKTETNAYELVQRGLATWAEMREAGFPVPLDFFQIATGEIHKSRRLTATTKKGNGNV